jgi:hypothetical protein
MSSHGKWQGWVYIKWKAGTPENAWQAWKKNEWVKGVWSTQGDWDCALWLDVKTPDQLEDFVWSKVRGNKWVESTETTWAKKLDMAA